MQPTPFFRLLATVSALALCHIGQAQEPAAATSLYAHPDTGAAVIGEAPKSDLEALNPSPVYAGGSFGIWKWVDYSGTFTGYAKVEGATPGMPLPEAVAIFAQADDTAPVLSDLGSLTGGTVAEAGTPWSKVTVSGTLPVYYQTQTSAPIATTSTQTAQATTVATSTDEPVIIEAEPVAMTSTAPQPQQANSQPIATKVEPAPARSQFFSEAPLQSDKVYIAEGGEDTPMERQFFSDAPLQSDKVYIAEGGEDSPVEVLVQSAPREQTPPQQPTRMQTQPRQPVPQPVQVQPQPQPFQVQPQPAQAAPQMADAPVIMAEPEPQLPRQATQLSPDTARYYEGVLKRNKRGFFQFDQPRFRYRLETFDGKVLGQLSTESLPAISSMETFIDRPVRVLGIPRRTKEEGIVILARFIGHR